MHGFVGIFFLEISFFGGFVKDPEGNWLNFVMVWTSEESRQYKSDLHYAFLRDLVVLFFEICSDYGSFSETHMGILARSWEKLVVLVVRFEICQEIYLF